MLVEYYRSQEIKNLRLSIIKKIKNTKFLLSIKNNFNISKRSFKKMLTSDPIKRIYIIWIIDHDYLKKTDHVDFYKLSNKKKKILPQNVKKIKNNNN